MSGADAAELARLEVRLAREYRAQAHAGNPAARNAMRHHARCARWFALLSGQPEKQVLRGGAR